MKGKAAFINRIFPKKQAGIPGRIALAGLLSVGMLLVCSKNSPLYPMNDWVDVNCFFTVGRGMVHGLTPYLDLVDQKGPLLYALYALAARISETSFLGVFLVEAACFAAFLYFSGRIAETVSGTPWAFGLTAAGLAVGIPLSPAFSHGGSAEELFLPVFALSLYLMLRGVRKGETLKAGPVMILGACAAAALWTKYTFCGLYTGLALAVVIRDIADFRGRNLLRMAGQALLGAALLSAAVLIRYAAAGALPALWQSYFVDNLTRYTQNIRSGNYAQPLPNLLNNLTWSVPAAGGLLFLAGSAKKRWRELLACLAGAVGLFVFTYASGRRYPYYAIVMACFGSLGFGALFALLPGDWKGRKAFRRTAAALAAAGIALGPAAGLAWGGNVYLMGTEKESMPQYRFAETIREAGDSSLLNYGFLDGGFYFAAGSLPETRYFCTLNNDLPEMRQEMNEALAEGKTEFVVTRGQKLKGGGYTLVDRAEMVFEGRKWTYFLWRKTGNQGK